MIWGLGYRRVEDRLAGSFSITFDPDRRTTNLFSAFIQDEIDLIDDRLRLTLGSKFEHNDFTGFEVQPDARLLWIPHPQHTLWAAISRAVRTPSRADHDVRLNSTTLGPGALFPGSPPALASTIGNRRFRSEDLIAFELGYRVQPTDRLFLDIAAFYNIYHRLRTLELGPSVFNPQPAGAPLVLPSLVDNKMRGEVYGLELAADWRPRDWLRLQGAYSLLEMRLHLDEDSTDALSQGAQGQSPQHQFSLRSSINLPKGLELDLWLRYVSRLPDLNIGSYLTLDARLAWRPRKDIEIALVGQNLLDDRHPEFTSEFIAEEPTQVPRGAYASISWRF